MADPAGRAALTHTGADSGPAARHLIPAGEAVWAQVAPANAASVRAFLAAGYQPVGAEAHLTRTGLGG